MKDWSASPAARATAWRSAIRTRPDGWHAHSGATAPSSSCSVRTNAATIVQLANVCNRAFEDRYPRAHKLRREARARLEDELKLIDELGLAGFFLLHWDVLELARECALEVRGRGSPRHALPPGRGRGSSVGSLVCYLTRLSHVRPVGAELSLGRFLNRELYSVPYIDLDLHEA